MWVTHKHSRSVRTLVVVLCIVVVNHSLASNLKSFVGLKTGHKRINIVTYSGGSWLNLLVGLQVIF